MNDLTNTIIALTPSIVLNNYQLIGLIIACVIVAYIGLNLVAKGLDDTIELIFGEWK